MEKQCNLPLKNIAANLKRANKVAREVYKTPEELQERVFLLRQVMEICSQAGDSPGSLEAMTELLDLYRPIVAEQKTGKPDHDLIYYLQNFSKLLEQNDKLLECVEIFDEYSNMLDQITEESPDTAELKKRQVEHKVQIERVRQKVMAQQNKEKEEEEDVGKPVDTSYSESESILNPQTTGGRILLTGLFVSAIAGIGFFVM